MPVITLPDGSQRTFEQAVSVRDVALSIGEGLAKAAIAGKVGDKLVDTMYIIEQDEALAIITAKSDEALEVIRHSTAHLLAQAVKELFPQAQVTIGPVIDNGFYYDFAYERTFTPDDLSNIEKKMTELAKKNFDVKRSVMSRDEAVKLFADMGEDYKVQIIKDIPSNEDLSLYQQGDFIDLCRGPHVPNTSFLKAFKLTKLAGAYWRGNSDNEMLQRIYGTAFADKKELKAYLQRLEEAQKRDHRKVGKALDLFHFQEEAPGMAFWHAKGWTLWQILEQYIRQYTRENGYEEIKTPQVVDRTLWEKSGHWAKFRDEMFVTETENHTFAVKPMSCPCHIQVFNQGLKSYRDLPLRYAEFGICHRCEPSGTLHGLMRVRGMVQDDGHIFCTEDQIQDEASRFIDQVFSIYQVLGFEDIMLKISTRPEQRVGSDEVWDKAEQCLIKAVEQKNIPWELNPGEGAFYGPKIEFSLRDCIDRIWQCGTLQVDFSMPERLEASYVAEDGSKQIPVMLHRAVLGSMERMIGILIEQYAGAFPAWLAPEQAVIATITDNQLPYAQSVLNSLRNRGIRASADLRNEKVGFKIREHTMQKVPYILVIGDKEMDSNTVAVRARNGDDLGSMSVDAFCQHIEQEVAGQLQVEKPMAKQPVC